MLTLGVDQGVESGWGIGRGTPGILCRVLKSGTARTAFQRAAVIAEFLQFAEILNEPMVAVREDHSSMPLTFKTRHDRKSGGKAQRSMKSILGQGGSGGRWDEQLELARIELRKVTPNDWFCSMSGWGASTGTDARKQWAVDYASAAIGRQPKSHNEADGVCITVWGGMNLAPTRRAK